MFGWRTDGISSGRHLRLRNALRLGFVFAGCFALAFVAGSLTFIPRESSAETGDSAVAIDVTASLATALSPSSLALPINPTPAGVEAVGELAIDVSTNNPTGYTLSMEFAAATANLVHSNNTDSIASTTNSPASAAPLAVNTWGYYPAAMTANPNPVAGNYHFVSVPVLGGARDLSVTTAPAGSSVTTITVGARANTAIPAGDYTGTLKFTAMANFVPPSPPVVLNVSPSSGHFRGGETLTITGTGFTDATAVGLKVGTGTQLACRPFTVVSDTTITCISPGVATTLQDGPGTTMTNPTNTASVNVTTSIGTNTTNTLFTYRYINKSFTTAGSYMDIRGTDIALGSKILVNGIPCTNQKITSSSTAACDTPVTTAGARTVTITPPPVSRGDMQGWAGCSGISIPSHDITDWAPYTRVLTDTRNGQNYRVRKLPDGRCWMIDNLKLSGVTLTPANSNVTTNFTIPANPVQNATTHSNGTGHTANGSGYLTTDGATYGSSNYAFIAFSDPSGTENSSYDNCIHSNGISSDSLTGCGYLYNWYTATAGTGTYANTIGSTATSSICPSGWTLPTGGYSSSQFAVLNNAMATGSATASTTNSATTRPNWRHNGPWEGSLSGYYYSGFSNTGYGGSYWSSTTNAAADGYSLFFYYSTLYPGTSYNSKNYGYAVRCVL